MIRLIDDLPDNVIGIEAIGEVRAGDYDSVIGPALDAALRIHDKLRLIYVLGDDFDGDSDGGIWKDATVGLARLSQWERIAIVTDHETYRDGIKAFGWIFPSQVKVFALADLTDAEAWTAE